jgi:ubiquinone biosynthesis accessory factor UbiK
MPLPQPVAEINVLHAAPKECDQIELSHQKSAALILSVQAACARFATLLGDGQAEDRMINGKAFDELKTKMEELLARTPARDVEKNMRALLSAFLNRLDLVTREEFDIQAEVLRRTREKLSQLEAKVAELERGGAATDER